MKEEKDIVAQTRDAADEYADRHGFRVPYDGSNNFYDETDVKASKEGFIEGAEWERRRAASEHTVPPLTDGSFVPPPDMDEDCIELCARLNALGDVKTTESCCGHLISNYMVFFECRSFARLAKLHRCVDRNYSDGMWEVLVDGTDMHPEYRFMLRSKEPFNSYMEMRMSVQRLIENIDWWENPDYDDYFNGIRQ